MNIKKPALIAGALAVVSLAGLGTAGAAYATTNNSAGADSLAQKIATKFNLNINDVKAVFDEDRSAHEAQRAADQAARLAQAVKDGKLTQEQADHITSALKEIDTLRGTARPNEQTDTVHTQIKAKMDELRNWAQTNNIDVRLIGPGGHMGMGHRPDDTDQTSTQNSTSTNTN